jgi:hypothetical protein
MSKKNLLNEGTIRRFMKLAEIEPLTNQFVGKINESEEVVTETEEPVEEGMDADYMDDEMMEEEMDLMGDEGDEGDEDPLAAEDDDMDLEDLLAEMDYQDDDEDELGPDMEDEEGDMEMDAEEGDMEMDVEMDMEEPAPAAGGMDPEAMREMVKDAVMDALKQLVDGGDLDISMEEPEAIDVAGDEEEPELEAEEEDEEEMVNEVARRVMKRIINSRR